MEDYIHRPVAHENDIRILHLEPARNFNDPLRCRLTEGNLHDKRSKYEALSYVWGSPTGDCPLIRERKQLLITPNCESALRHLRFKWKIRSLWIDSICINQQSNSERNHQVRLMGNIYEMARRVLVWLGESDVKTRSAFALLKTFAVLRKLPFDTTTMTWISHWGKAHKVLGDRSGGLLNGLCRKPWFNRLWTIQEVALSLHILAICGYDSISWPLLTSEVLNQLQPPSFHGIRFVPWQTTGLWVRLNVWKTFHEKLHLDKTHITAHALRFLVFAMRQSCADPKDKIFGLYTIFNRLSFSVPDPDSIKPSQLRTRSLPSTMFSILKPLALWVLCVPFNEIPIFQRGFQITPILPSS